MFAKLVFIYRDRAFRFNIVIASLLRHLTISRIFTTIPNALSNTISKKKTFRRTYFKNTFPLFKINRFNQV
jgi:hypothetical protein